MRRPPQRSAKSCTWGGAVGRVRATHSVGKAVSATARVVGSRSALNDDAMRGRTYNTITVKSVATERWMREHIKLQANDRLVWKSDTQGYDELIISLTPLEIWERVDVAIIELWRIRKPDFDRAAFASRIDGFPNNSIGIGNCRATADIFEYLDGDDYHHDDLYLWR